MQQPVASAKGYNAMDNDWTQRPEATGISILSDAKAKGDIEQELQQLTTATGIVIGDCNRRYSDQQ